MRPPAAQTPPKPHTQPTACQYQLFSWPLSAARKRGVPARAASRLPRRGRKTPIVPVGSLVIGSHQGWMPFRYLRVRSNLPTSCTSRTVPSWLRRRAWSAHATRHRPSTWVERGTELCQTRGVAASRAVRVRVLSTNGSASRSLPWSPSRGACVLWPRPMCPHQDRIITWACVVGAIGCTS